MSMQIDLSPIIVKKVAYKDVTLLAKEPIKIYLEWEDMSDMIYSTDQAEEYGVSVHGDTRDELIVELNIQLAVLWKAYAKAPDEILTDGAKRIKYKLINSFEEIN